jgi:hypothetical protein
MKRALRGLGLASACAVALAASALAQSYPPYPEQQPYPAQNYPPQPYPSQPYPAQQSYPAQQPYPGQPYPAQSYPPQGYPARPYPAQNYPAQNYPVQQYPAQNAPARPVATSSVCVRLETQLATVNNSAGDPARAEQIKRAQDAVAKQQADLDRTLAQAHRIGCAGEGFFSLFSGFSPRCGPLTSQIQQMRGNLDNLISELERLKSGSGSQDAQRSALISQLAQNNCGSQYTTAARNSGPQGFFEALLGGGTVVNPNGNGAPAGTYRTVCVRTCDGFYFPVSYSTVPSRFGDDANTCQRLCPASQVSLYTYRNPGEEIEQAVSTGGAQYTALPNAFRYRKEIVAGCTCRAAGESWAQALRNADDSTTLESGDIVVTDKNAKLLSQIPASGKPPVRGAAPAPAATPAPPASNGAANPVIIDSKNRKVRVVGPTFISQH